MLDALFFGDWMKEIITLIRREKTKATKQKLADQEFIPYTEKQVLGRGKQLGLHYPQMESSPWPSLGIPFLPKSMLTIFVNDENVEQVIAIIKDANKTGEIGDGKIFVCPAEDVVRIRTDERGREALSITEERDINASV